MKYKSEYNAWRSLKQRCTYKKHKSYHYYGGRGISYDKRWESFKNFFEDMGEKPDRKFELDRIDSNKDYSKENCRWIDKKTQQRNQRRTVLITYKGITKKRCEWAEILGIHPDTIRKRLSRGKSIERAFSNLNHRHKHEVYITK